MTDHRRIRDDLALYVTGDLDATRAAAVAAHVAGCAECASAADELRATVERVRDEAHPVERVPEALANLDVPSAIPLATAPRARWMRAAALLIAFGLGIAVDRAWGGRDALPPAPTGATVSATAPVPEVPEQRWRVYEAASRARSGFSRGLAALAQLSRD